MLNSICSPEMSFNSKSSEDQPHAYVAYVDGSKACVPVSFVCKFPTNWREQGWNKNYLFKVFWSPEENDCPAAMLRREVEIPVIKGEDREIAGFYRASVELVKGMFQRCVLLVFFKHDLEDSVVLA